MSLMIVTALITDIVWKFRIESPNKTFLLIQASSLPEKGRMQIGD